MEALRKAVSSAQMHLGNVHELTFDAIEKLADSFFISNRYLEALDTYRHLSNDINRSSSDVGWYRRFTVNRKLSNCLYELGTTAQTYQQRKDNFEYFMEHRDLRSSRFLLDKMRKMKNHQPSIIGTKANGLQLDGKDDYLVIPDLYFDGQSPVTLEMIVRVDSFNDDWGRTSLISTIESGGISLDLDRGRPRLALSVTRYQDRTNWQKKYAAAKSNSEFPLGKLVHIAGAWDGKTLKLFVDGKLVGEQHDVVKCANVVSHPYCIGADPDLSGDQEIFQGQWIGLLQQVRISEAILYDQDFVPPVDLMAQIDSVAAYDFRNNTREFAVDMSGRGNHAVIMGDAKWQSCARDKTAN